MIGFIYDQYLINLNKAVEYYKKYSEFSEGEQIIIVNDRLSEIETNLSDLIDGYKQKIAYFKGLDFIYAENFDPDSSRYYFEECNTYNVSVLQDKCQNLVDIIKLPISNTIIDSLEILHFEKWVDNTNMDISIYNTAKMFHKDFQRLDIAKSYYKILIDF